MDSDYLDLALHDDMNLDQDSHFPLLLKPGIVHGGLIPTPAFGVATESSQQVLVQEQLSANPASSQNIDSTIQMQMDAIDLDQANWKCLCSFAKHGTSHGVTWSRILIEHQDQFAQLYERFPDLDSNKVKSNDLKQILALMLNLNDPDELVVVGPYPRKEESGFHAYLQLLPQHYVSFYSYMHHVCMLGVLFHGIVALMDVRWSMPDWVRSNIKDFGFPPPPECPPDNLDFLIHGESLPVDFKLTCLNLMDYYRSKLRKLEPFSIDLKHFSDGINDIGVSKSLALLGVSQPHLEYIKPIGPVPNLWEVRATTSHVHCVGHGFRATEARRAALIHLLVLVIDGGEPSAFNDLDAGRGTTALIKPVDEILGEISIQRRSRDKNIEMDGFSYVMPPTMKSTIGSNSVSQHSSASPPMNLISTFRNGHHESRLNPDANRHRITNAGSPNSLRSRSPYRASAVHQQQAPLYHSLHPNSNEHNMDTGYRTIQPTAQQAAGHYHHAGAGVYGGETHPVNNPQQSLPSDRFESCSGFSTVDLRQNISSKVINGTSEFDVSGGITTASLRHNTHSGTDNTPPSSRHEQSGYRDSEGITTASLRQNIRSSSRPAHSEYNESEGITTASLRQNIRSSSRPARSEYNESEGITTASLRCNIRSSSRPAHSEYNESEGITTASLRQNIRSSSRPAHSEYNESEGITTASLRQNIRSSSRPAHSEYNESEGLTTASLRYNNDSEVVNRSGSKPAQPEFHETEDYRFNSYHRNDSKMINPTFARHEHESASAGNLRHNGHSGFADQLEIRPIHPGHPEYNCASTSGMWHNGQSYITNSDGFGARPNAARHCDEISAVKYPHVPPHAMLAPHLSGRGANGYENMYPIRPRPRPIEPMPPVAYSDTELNGGRYDHHAGAGKWPTINEPRNRFENVDSDIAITDLQNDINNLRTYVHQQKSMFIHREQMYLRNQHSLQAQINNNDAALQTFMLMSANPYGNPQIMAPPISASPFYTPINPNHPYINNRSGFNEASYPTAGSYSRPSVHTENRINGYELYGMYDRPNR